MNIALLDKDLFASLLRFGEIKVPDFLCSKISDELSEEKALSLILDSGNPIEYPSEYIIVKYQNDGYDKVDISGVIELIATTSEGKRTFESQFRDDLNISDSRYSYIFAEYATGKYESERIMKGINAFRTLCGLESKEFKEEAEVIKEALRVRLTYRHHYQIPKEYCNNPYLLMMVYDRHAPYPNTWAGFFYDVIETFCYHVQPEMGYKDAPIEHTQIYKIIASLGSSAKTQEILSAIENESFTSRCNDFFYKPGGFLVPYIFYILRTKLRECESVKQIQTLISSIKDKYPEAFDTASIYVGGFFGYDKFYDDYYSYLKLPIFKTKPSVPKPSTAPAEVLMKKEHSLEKAEDSSKHTGKFLSRLKDAIKSAFPKSSREKYYTKIDELGETPQILENFENLLNTDELCAEKFKTIFCLDRKPREKQIEEFKKAYKETTNIWS